VQATLHSLVAESQRQVYRADYFIFHEDDDNQELHIIPIGVENCLRGSPLDPIYIPTPWRCALALLRDWEITVGRTSSNPTSSLFLAGLVPVLDSHTTVLLLPGCPIIVDRLSNTCSRSVTQAEV
jgi:hypothetical protein